MELGARFPRHEKRGTVQALIDAGRAKWIIPGYSAQVVFQSQSIPEEARNVPSDNLPSVELPGIRFVPPVRRTPIPLPSECVYG